MRACLLYCIFTETGTEATRLATDTKRLHSKSLRENMVKWSVRGRRTCDCNYIYHQAELEVGKKRSHQQIPGSRSLVTVWPLTPPHLTQKGIAVPVLKFNQKWEGRRNLSVSHSWWRMILKMLGSLFLCFISFCLVLRHLLMTDTLPSTALSYSLCSVNSLIRAEQVH